MNLLAARHRLAAVGVTVFHEGGTLKASGSPDALGRVRELIRGHKVSLLAFLTAPPCPQCGRQTDELHACWKCGTKPCRGCGRGTGSPFLSWCDACGRSEPEPPRPRCDCSGCHFLRTGKSRPITEKGI